jgi:hypothetical protein
MHFLKVDEPVGVGLVSLMRKGHVLEGQRHKRNDGRDHLINGHAVGPVVSGGVNEGLELGKDLSGLGGKAFPGLTHPRHCHVPQAHHNGKERVNILVLLAAVQKSYSKLI